MIVGGERGRRRTYGARRRLPGELCQAGQRADEVVVIPKTLVHGDVRVHGFIGMLVIALTVVGSRSSNGVRFHIDQRNR